MKKSDFEALQKTWYEKLKRKGFSDIEKNEYDFKGTMESFLDKRRVTWQATEEYYRLSTHFLNDHKFASRIEQIIWEYHTNGISGRDIADILNKVRKKKILRMTVWRIVKRLENIMKDKYLAK
jgi:hypothetical protein